MKNGELLRAAEMEFDALVTMDQGIEHQQNLSTLAIGVVVVSAGSNRRQDVEPAMPAVNGRQHRSPNDSTGPDGPGDGLTSAAPDRWPWQLW